MIKGERKRTMVYSNVNKKADYKSASNKDDVIDLDNEIVIGLASLPKPDMKKQPKKKNNSNKINQGKNHEKNIPKKIENEDKNSVKTSKKNKLNPPKETMQDKIRRKKIRIIRKISIFLVLLFFLIAGIIYFFLSPIFNIKRIDVINNNYIKDEQIIKSSKIKENDNIFKFSKKDARNTIMSNPYIEDVKISRDIFNHTVQIDVKERTATLMLEYGNSYVYINNQGYILEISTIKLDTPVLKGYITPLEQIKPGNRLGKDDLERLETVLSIMETASSNDLEKLITQIDIEDKNNYILTLESEDKTVYLGSCSDLSTQMLYVKDMIGRARGVEGEFFVNMDLNKGRPFFREKV